MISAVPYTTEGWLDVGRLMPHVLPFTWIWGGRGIGKTFGFLLDVRYNNPRQFLILRRTKTQFDLLKKTRFNPFIPVDRLAGGFTAVVAERDTATFYNGVQEGDNIVPQGPPIGYALALSTMHNVRGIDLSDVDVVIYDEFIPERHERPIQHEYTAWENAIETVSRNRELQGRPPLQFIGLTNSNTLDNPYFVGMEVIRTVDKMLQEGREIWTDRARGLMLINITHSPISDRKAKTALYKLAGKNDFTEMSLGNKFAGEHCSNKGSFPLVELRPVVAVGELTIYKHKSKQAWYVCDHYSGNPPKYAADDMNLLRFRRDYTALWKLYLANALVFQDIMAEILFKKYFAV